MVSFHVLCKKYISEYFKSYSAYWSERLLKAHATLKKILVLVLKYLFSHNPISMLYL